MTSGPALSQLPATASSNWLALPTASISAPPKGWWVNPEDRSSFQATMSRASSRTGIRRSRTPSTIANITVVPVKPSASVSPAAALNGFARHSARHANRMSDPRFSSIASQHTAKPAASLNRERNRQRLSLP